MKTVCQKDVSERPLRNAASTIKMLSALVALVACGLSHAFAANGDLLPISYGSEATMNNMSPGGAGSSASNTDGTNSGDTTSSAHELATRICVQDKDSVTDKSSPDVSPCKHPPSVSAESARVLTVEPLPIPDRHWCIAEAFNASLVQQSGQTADTSPAQTPSVAQR